MVVLPVEPTTLGLRNSNTVLDGTSALKLLTTSKPWIFGCATQTLGHLFAVDLVRFPFSVKDGESIGPMDKSNLLKQGSFSNYRQHQLSNT